MGSNLFIFAGILFLMVAQVTCQCNGTLTLQAGPSPQYFTSVGYPSNYDDDLECYWLVKAPAAADRVVINIQETLINGSDNCTRDYINVYDGDSNSSTLLATVCDRNDDDYNVFVSTGDALFLWLHTDENGTSNGFVVLYFSNDTSAQADCSDNILTASANTRYLMSSNLPGVYTPGFNCTTYIQSTHPSFVLEFQFFLLDVEETRSCTGDVFTISEGTDTSSLTIIDSQCTTAETYSLTDVTTQHPLAAVTLETISSINSHYGFLISYRQDQSGINLTYPNYDQTISLTIPEDHDIDVINSSEARINVTSEGTLSFTLTQDGSSSNLDFQQTQGADSGTYNIDILNSLDYETRTSHLLTIVISDDVNTVLSGTVHFNITLTDVDDHAPDMTNLPGSATVRRIDTAGLSVYNVTSTDGDTTPAFQVPAYMIFGGNSDGLLAIDQGSGEITLAIRASAISLSVTSYVIQIAAFSVSLSSGIASFATFTLNFYPDDPPACSHVTVWGDTISADDHGGGTVITFSNPWNCSDESTISYSMGTVTPTLTPVLFSVSQQTGDVTITRAFSLTEVPTRLFNLTLIATDILGQTTEFSVLINVTTLACTPNPAKLYVRMGTAPGSVVDTTFTCTRSNLSFSIKQQYPSGTFAFVDNSLILLKEVYKILFYSLVIEVSDGADTVELAFRVTTRLPQCNYKLSGAVATLASVTAVIMAAWVTCLVT